MAEAGMGATDEEPRLTLDQDEPSRSPYVHPPYREPVKVNCPAVSRLDLGRIGRELQAMYQALLAEPVPDHLADLIHRLEPRGVSR